MKKRTLLLTALAAALLAVVAPMGAYADDDENGGKDDDRGSKSDDGKACGKVDVYGITADGRLIVFRSDKPEKADTVGRITGLTGDTRLVGIDFRPANGLLYGVGDRGGLYTLNQRTAVATKVGQLSVPLEGTSFGVDVNPVPDALRIISDTGQNLRYSFAAGTTTADTPLTYPPATTRATGVTGAAYTNNDSDPNTATTLFDIDSTMDQVAIQSPANSGTLAPTGKLGVDTNAVVGFDIYSEIRNGTTSCLAAYASLTVNGQARFYSVNLLQGRTSLVGSFSSQNQVTGIAIELDR